MESFGEFVSMKISPELNKNMMKLPILMYHYVRPLHKRISIRHKVLDLELFDQQLEVLATKHVFVLGRDLVGQNKSDLFGQDNIWLTFDDGYRDCVEYVLPALLKRGLTGSFFVPTEAIFERKLLDVTKIHLMLSSVENVGKIISATKRYYIEAKIEMIVGESFDELYFKFGIQFFFQYNTFR